MKYNKVEKKYNCNLEMGRGMSEKGWQVGNQ